MNPAAIAAAIEGAKLAMQIFDLAAAGVPRAMAAAATIRRLVAEGRDPTPAEWAELQQESATMHARVQAAAREDDGA